MMLRNEMQLLPWAVNSTVKLLALVREICDERLDFEARAPRLATSFTYGGCHVRS
jgi:hypothetical protein